MAKASLGPSFRDGIQWRLGRLFLIVLISFSCVSAASAAKRVALVIGIDGYQNLPKLEKAVSDARASAPCWERSALTSLPARTSRAAR
jgi:hypothetical protein